MVQDVVFGLKTSWDGIGFEPFITAAQRNGTFRSMKVIEMRNLVYRGTRNDIVVHLPPADSFSQGVCALDRVVVNGQAMTGEFMAADALRSTNRWDVYLKAPTAAGGDAPIRKVDVARDAEIFAPAQPEWQDEGVALEDGRVVLTYRHENAGQVAFDIFRDGVICAAHIPGTKWIDPLSGDDARHVHTYVVTAVDRQSGLCSHPTPGRSYRTSDQELVIPASELKNSGGNRIGDHIENWGKPYDELETEAFVAKSDGRCAVRVEFSNGSGPVNTGITCAVKKIEIRAAESGEVVSSGYLVMPQSGDWTRWDQSNSIFADFEAGARYTILISEDGYSRNMSYLKNNERYTAGPGGGARNSNFVNIAGVHLLYSGSPASEGTETSAAAAKAEPVPALVRRRRRSIGQREVAEVL